MYTCTCICNLHYIHNYTYTCMYIHVHQSFGIFEGWVKLTQQYRVQHWEYILNQNNKDLHVHVHVVNAVRDNLIIHLINCAIWPKERTVQYLIRSSLSRLWADGATYELIENSDV